MQPPTERVKIFICYSAENKEMELTREFVECLQNNIDTNKFDIFWDRARFSQKTKIENDILQNKVCTCDIALLVVSEDFEKSPYCQDLELRILLKRKIPTISIPFTKYDGRKRDNFLNTELPYIEQETKLEKENFVLKVSQVIQKYEYDKLQSFNQNEENILFETLVELLIEKCHKPDYELKDTIEYTLKSYLVYIKPWYSRPQGEEAEPYLVGIRCEENGLYYILACLKDCPSYCEIDDANSLYISERNTKYTRILKLTEEKNLYKIEISKNNNYFFYKNPFKNISSKNGGKSFSPYFINPDERKTPLWVNEDLESIDEKADNCPFFDKKGKIIGFYNTPTAQILKITDKSYVETIFSELLDEYMLFDSDSNIRSNGSISNIVSFIYTLDRAIYNYDIGDNKKDTKAKDELEEAINQIQDSAKKEKLFRIINLAFVSYENNIKHFWEIFHEALEKYIKQNTYFKKIITIIEDDSLDNDLIKILLIYSIFRYEEEIKKPKIDKLETEIDTTDLAIDLDSIMRHIDEGEKNINHLLKLWLVAKLDFDPYNVTAYDAVRKMIKSSSSNMNLYDFLVKDFVKKAKKDITEENKKKLSVILQPFNKVFIEGNSYKCLLPLITLKGLKSANFEQKNLIKNA